MRVDTEEQRAKRASNTENKSHEVLPVRGRIPVAHMDSSKVAQMLQVDAGQGMGICREQSGNQRAQIRAGESGPIPVYIHSEPHTGT